MLVGRVMTLNVISLILETYWRDFEIKLTVFMEFEFHLNSLLLEKPILLQ